MTTVRGRLAAILNRVCKNVAHWLFTLLRPGPRGVQSTGHVEHKLVDQDQNGLLTKCSL